MSKKTRKRKNRLVTPTNTNTKPNKETNKSITPKTSNTKYEGKNKILRFYFNNYKKLFIIPILLFIIAVAMIGFKTATTGDFINKGISLKVEQHSQLVVI